MSLEECINEIFNHDPIEEGFRDVLGNKTLQSALLAGGLAVGAGAAASDLNKPFFQDHGAQSSFSTSYNPHLDANTSNLGSNNISHADIDPDFQDDSEPQRLTVDDFMEQIGPHEGFRKYVYDDRTGRRIHPGTGTSHSRSRRTVGYGFNMDQPDALRYFTHAGGTEEQFRKIRFGHNPISTDLARNLFRQGVIRAMREVNRSIDDLSSHSKQVQLAMVDMAYNLGSIRGFPRMVQAINARNYEEAAWQMLHIGGRSGDTRSVWANEVGQRADTLADMVRSAAEKEPDNRAVESVFAPMPNIFEYEATVSDMGKMITDVLRLEGSLSIQSLISHITKNHYSEPQGDVNVIHLVKSALLMLRRNGIVQVDQHGTVELQDEEPMGITESKEATDHKDILDDLPRTERALERQYLDAGELSKGKGIKGVTIRFAVPKRVYRVYLNGKHIGWLDYRNDSRETHLVGEWEEPKGTIPDSRKDEMLAYLDRINTKRRT